MELVTGSVMMGWCESGGTLTSETEFAFLTTGSLALPSRAAVEAGRSLIKAVRTTEVLSRARYFWGSLIRLVTILLKVHTSGYSQARIFGLCSRW